MEDLILQYLKPELLILIPVLYFIGLGLKKLEFIKDKYIPVCLGVFSIICVFFYLLGTCGWDLNIIWTSIVQGCLAAAGSVYINQIYKQLTKKE